MDHFPVGLFLLLLSCYQLPPSFCRRVSFLTLRINIFILHNFYRRQYQMKQKNTAPAWTILQPQLLVSPSRAAVSVFSARQH